MDLLTTAIPIAAGATGEVFEVFDPRLRRRVAIKLPRQTDPESLQRMLREARAQARVDHPNVCRIYDVGERDGRPCITMQLVEGVTLDRAVADLPLEARVELVATVAEAVQAAHAVGLVHRDLKPANILVEQRDGVPTPVVVDFGLAREIHSQGMTVTGAVLGTPAYMSPEQVRGDVRAIDRRSDVFSLAVVLYELVADRHPFSDATAVRTMLAITDHDPPPLRRSAPATPEDLAAVIEKGLEKDVGRRYQSAAAFAEDLRRFLAGSPVSARRISRFERVRRRARRNPVLASALAVTAVVLLAAAAIVARTRIEAEKQARLAQTFARDVEQAETLLRLGHLSPAHDLRRERELIVERLRSIESDVATIGRSAIGPGAYALARGALVLDDPEAARRRVGEALEAGFDGPRVHLTLAQAHLDLLDEALRHADRLHGVADRTEARAEALEGHGGAVRDALQAGGLLPEDGRRESLPGRRDVERDLLSARLALAAERWAEARELGRRSAEPFGWFYDGLLVAAEADLREAAAALDGGRPAEDLLRRARETLAAAGERAPSDPDVPLGLCRAWNLEGTRIRATAAAEAALTRATERCDLALELLPGRRETLSVRAHVGWRHGSWLQTVGRDPGVALDHADAAARSLAEVHGARGEAFRHLANTGLTRAEWARDQGRIEEARRLVRIAIERFGRAIDHDPGNALLYEGASRAWRMLADWDWAGDWEPALREASRVARRGLEVAGGSLAGLHRSECETRFNWAYQARHLGVDPAGHAESSVRHCRRALELRPGDPSIRGALALALWTAADVALARGEDARADLEAAADAFRRLLEDSPDFYSADVNRGSVLLSLAEERLEHGGPVDGILAQVAAHAERIREVYPIDHAVHRARLDLVRARAAVAAGADEEAGGSFARARAAAGNLVERWPSPPTNPVLAAEIDRREAEWRAERGEAAIARRRAETARAAMEAVVADHGDLSAAWIELALATAVLAESGSDATRPGLRERAAEAARRARGLASWVPARVEEIARWAGAAGGVAPSDDPLPHTATGSRG